MYLVFELGIDGFEVLVKRIVAGSCSYARSVYSRSCPAT